MRQLRFQVTWTDLEMVRQMVVEGDEQVMDDNVNGNSKLGMDQEQLISMLQLANGLSLHKLDVLCTLIRYMEPGTLKTNATRGQIRELAGLNLRTI